jgi:hypothetical protein
MSHHWLDSTHISFGVVTAGLYGRSWKAEASLFNGREPDDRRYDVDLDAMDSYSGRLWVMPHPSISVQVSAGHLREAEIDHHGDRHDVNRVTASATYHRLTDGRLNALTVAWGLNRESDHSTSALLAEASFDVTAADTWFMRAELARKTAEELVLPLPESEDFTLRKLQAGYRRWIGKGHGFAAGVGGSIGISALPRAVELFYGGRAMPEIAVFAVLSPRR